MDISYLTSRLDDSIKQLTEIKDLMQQISDIEIKQYGQQLELNFEENYDGQESKKEDL